MIRKTAQPAVAAEQAAELQRLEQHGWQALSGTDGAAFYEQIMADDGLMIFPGLVLDKRGTVAAIAAAPPWASFELADVRVLELGADAAVVTYRATAQRAGESPYHALMSSAYARREGTWQLVLHQQTPIPDRTT